MNNPRELDELSDRRTFVSDLMRLISMPEQWRGRDPEAMAGALLDALAACLDADFIYAQLEKPDCGTPFQALRARALPPGHLTPPADEVGRALAPWLASGTGAHPATIDDPLGPGQTVIIAQPLGTEDDRLGAIVAGSRRAGFPSQSDGLLLRIATTQWLAELREAEACHVRQRAARLQEAQERLLGETLYLRHELNCERDWQRIIGRSEALAQVRRQVEHAARTNACVLISGESGTGKELIARAVHGLSDRHSQAFVKVDCATFSASQLEAELFGREGSTAAGASNGALVPRIGRVELADGGSLFLEQIGELPPALQSRLLRLQQDQAFERLGGTQSIQVDVRLIAASNRDPNRLTAERGFNPELLSRLNALPIVLPPLRERVDDIPLLVRHFVDRHARHGGKQIGHIEPDTMAALCRYAWPGNVRELDHLMHRSVMLSSGASLEVPLAEIGSQVSGPTGLTLEDAQRQHILRALNESSWVVAGRSGAAARLGMKRTSLQSKMQKLGIFRPRIEQRNGAG